MTISALPTPPTRQDPANFASRADVFLAALPTFQSEANSTQVQINAKEASAQAAASAAASSAAGVTASVTAAANSASTAAASATQAAGSATQAAASVTSSQTNASNAAISATNAQTSATAAATSASNAAASLTAIGTSVSQSAASASNAATSASNAATSASNAETSASNAQTFAQNASVSANSAAQSAISAVNAPGTNATSTTSQTISVAPKTFAIQTGKAFVIGQFVIAAVTASPANYMVGQITAHNPSTGSLTIDVTAINGTGTFSDWTIGNTAFSAAGGGTAATTIAVGTNNTANLQYLLFTTGIGNQQVSIDPTTTPLSYVPDTGTLSVPALITLGGAINGASIGATTPATGRFTTLEATGSVTFNANGSKITVSGTGSTLSLNPATSGSIDNVVIGGTTPLAASFTTLSATGAATLNGTGNKLSVSGTGSTLVINPATTGSIDSVNLGATTAGSGRFTTLASTGAVNFTVAGNQISISGTGSVFNASPATAGALNNLSIGATTPLSGAFTTLSATGAATLTGTGNKLSVTGVGSTLAINPATVGSLDSVNIGATTPGSGAFTTLSANSAVTFVVAGNKFAVSGTGSEFNASPAISGALNNLSIGATTPLSGAFTTLSATGAATLATASFSANSSGSAVTITQTGTGAALAVLDAADPDNTPFIIDANGDVLIGRTTTEAVGVKLQVTGGVSLNSQADVAMVVGQNGTSDLLIGSTGGSAPFIASQGASPLSLYTNAVERLRLTSLGNIQAFGGFQETRVVMGASNNVDVSAGNVFTKTITGATTLVTVNLAPVGTVMSFILDLTNGGSAAITWFTNTRWNNGTPPTLTASGRDILGFFSHDAGTNWNGLVLAKDIR